MDSMLPVQPNTPSPFSDGNSLWEKFRKSVFFPIASIIFLAVIILGLGFAVVGLINRSGGGRFVVVKGPTDVPYVIAGGAELTLNVLRAAYQDTYNNQKPLAPGRKFVVVEFEITNEGDANAGPITREDMRLITPDGSIMPPAGWSKDFLDYGYGVDQTREGEVVFDIDERNSLKQLTEFQIAFGKNPGSRAHYPLTAR